MEITIVCDHCNHSVNPMYTKLITTSDGVESWCIDCAVRHAHRCEHCDRWYAEDVLTTVHTQEGWHFTCQQWCPTCVDEGATECDECGELWDNRVIREYWFYDGSTAMLCPSCRNNCYCCDSCGGLIHEEDAYRTGWETFCPTCHRRRNVFRSYGHTSGQWYWQDDGTRIERHCLYGEKAKTIYLGVELETDYNDDAYELSADLMNEFDDTQIVCKRDGSLWREGVEIVSQPMTTNYHLNSGMWERIIDIVREHGGKSHNAGTCGLHIHLSRYALTDHDVVYRMDRLFHRFKRQFVNFSRRTNFDYCQLDDDDLANVETIAKRKELWNDKKRGEGRYVALNDENEATVEVRLWRGTLNPITFKATIEMTTGLALICNSMSDEFADALTWGMLKMLVRFALEQNGISHVELDEYLALRNL